MLYSELPTTSKELFIYLSIGNESDGRTERGQGIWGWGYKPQICAHRLFKKEEFTRNALVCINMDIPIISLHEKWKTKVLSMKQIQLNIFQLTKPILAQDHIHEEYFLEKNLMV